MDAIWAELDMDPGNVVGICVRSIKACPGTTYCKRGQLDSLGLGKILDEKYHGMELPGKMKIGVSGCPNQCGETSFKDIGLVGTPKGWRVYVGGNGGTNPRNWRDPRPADRHRCRSRPRGQDPWLLPCQRQAEGTDGTDDRAARLGAHGRGVGTRKRWVTTMDYQQAISVLTKMLENREFAPEEKEAVLTAIGVLDWAALGKTRL